MTQPNIVCQKVGQKHASRWRGGVGHRPSTRGA
uniref:Uncharacterized protein n=1 Tax=Zea mays TaxID=4577 RepID=C4J7R1_MAIZE|nr:unknown [Zea mays]